jgi:hypothetical protein
VPSGALHHAAGSSSAAKRFYIIDWPASLSVIALRQSSKNNNPWIVARVDRWIRSKLR